MGMLICIRLTLFIINISSETKNSARRTLAFGLGVTTAKVTVLLDMRAF
jgi:hypothetical protein